MEETKSVPSYEELLKAARAMHTWIFLHSGNEELAYKACGLSDEMSAFLGYSGSYTLTVPGEDVQPVKWIPVTERLPGIGEKVITYCKGYGVKENFRSGDGTWWVGFKITHWMPLPEPPKDNVYSAKEE